MDPTTAEPSATHNRKGFGLKLQVQGILTQDYRSRIVDLIRARGFTLSVGDVTFRLAKEFGFCYGVERAVDMAYETRERFPDRTIVITNEIIHNPYVNQRLRQMGVRFLDASGEIDCSSVRPEDVVLIPAFGCTEQQMQQLRTKGCVLVDTTCGSVLNVWKRVERYARDGITAVVHGKWFHEETRATCSRVLRYPGGRYVVVRDLAEADILCDYIRRGGDRAAFLARFAESLSPGFDPDRHLERLGVANQTTMLSSESLAIASRLGRAIEDRYGPEEGAPRFLSFDTICSATQDRQDAVVELGKERLDIFLVIGGFNSSNTGHLAELGGGFAPTYHIDGAARIISRERISHLPPHDKDPVVTEGWLPEGPLVLGITAGASTPNRIVGEVIERILELRGLSLQVPEDVPISPPAWSG